MLVRARAPMRLGLAGGGTDVSPYCDQYGGAVLNATINMFATTTIEVGESLHFEAADLDISVDSDVGKQDIRGDLVLHKAVYNRVMEEFNSGEYLPLSVVTYSDAPPGSGLGTSSTVVVSMLKAYQELLGLPFGEYDLAHLAYEIERIDCKLAGGKQDQYSASFGGINYIEFSERDQVIVNPLRVRQRAISELEINTILFFTGVSRSSSLIIQDQIEALTDCQRLEAMHEVKKSARTMKEAILKSDIAKFTLLQKQAWEAKKKTSGKITNPQIDEIAINILAAGATSLKVSGAGGGGFMMIFVEPSYRYAVIKALKSTEGRIYNFNFTDQGAQSWRVS